MSSTHKDPMARLLYDHENISEFTDNYAKIIDLKYSGKKWRNMDEIRDFFRINVTEHIAFEEQVVFPAVIKHSANQLLAHKLVEELLNDHEEMRAALKELIQSLDSMAFPLTDRQHGGFLDKSKKLLDKMQAHAAVEDNRLVPMVKNILHVFDDEPDKQVRF